MPNVSVVGGTDALRGGAKRTCTVPLVPGNSEMDGGVTDAQAAGAPTRSNRNSSTIWPVFLTVTVAETSRPGSTSRWDVSRKMAAGMFGAW
jgi:hypothetical protein